MNIIPTSGERLNCSFNAVLLCLFSYLLEDDRTEQEIKAALNGRPVSFIKKFNEIHRTCLTTTEFMGWIKFQRYSTGDVDKGFIQMLSPALRVMVFQMHQDKVLGQEIYDCDFKTTRSNNKTGMQKEATFNYLYLLFGIPIEVHREAYNHLCNHETHRDLEYAQPDSSADSAGYKLHIHQDSGFSHFSALGVTKGGVYMPYKLSSGTRHHRYGGGKDLASALQADIFHRFDETKVRGLNEEELCALKKHEYQVDADFVKQFLVSGNLHDAAFFAHYINSNFANPQQINQLVDRLLAPETHYDRILIDIIFALSLIGAYRVYKNITQDESYYVSSSRHSNDIESMVRELAVSV